MDRIAVGGVEPMEGLMYPGWGDIPLAEARRALTIARRLRRDVRKLLPKDLFRRKRA